MAKIAVLGYGTVGSGVVEVLRTNGAVMAERLGETIEVKHVLDRRTFPGDPIEAVLTADYERILVDQEVEVVCEVMGGLHPAYEFVKQALEHGKSVVTSNKELVAQAGTELLAVARKHAVNFLFEASVGGGIPIIRPLYKALIPEQIDEIIGILNGTTNFMLTAMEQDGADFDQVLAKAQKLGYAEADPTADVGGHDARRKIAILSSIAYEKAISFEDVYTEGITQLSAADFHYAKALGCTIKLVGRSRRSESGISAAVMPLLLEKDHPLAGVNGVMNAIFAHGNTLGDVMFYGSGAGKLPTASAVVSDVCACLQNRDRDIAAKWSEQVQPLEDVKQESYRHLLRFPDVPRQSRLEQYFGEGVILQPRQVAGEYAYLTAAMTETQLEAALTAWQNAGGKERIGRVRMYNA
ncbi:MAG: homoserine dehydrogenase [Eubacteriales bacterium]|nr:homoserine dehydrogenase [Eubacteriales bacterium]